MVCRKRNTVRAVNRDSFLSAEYLNDCFVYDPEDGALWWKKRPESHFKTIITSVRWNSCYAGKMAGTTRMDGYKAVSVSGKRVLVHRVIWKMENGECKGQIDHINGNPADNRIANLRLVSHGDNIKNMKRDKRNTLGIMGVYWLGGVDKWVARIGVDGKNVHLGLFGGLFEAASARKSAERRYNFHLNHGRSS